MAFEAVRIATEFMTPVFILSDGYIANGGIRWIIPKLDSLPRIKITHPTQPNGTVGGPAHENGAGEMSKYLPYKRNDMLARPWAIPGTPGLEHRIGGIEKQDVTGNVNYDPANHEHMIKTRAKKIANIALTIPDLVPEGQPEGDLLVIGWGGTYGAIATAVQRVQRKGFEGRRKPICAIQSNAQEHRGGFEAFQEDSGSGAECRSTPDVVAGEVSGRCHRPEQDPGPAVSWSAKSKRKSTSFSPDPTQEVLQDDSCNTARLLREFILTLTPYS